MNVGKGGEQEDRKIGARKIIVWGQYNYNREKENSLKDRRKIRSNEKNLIIRNQNF
jgi:hypothetical protein